MHILRRIEGNTLAILCIDIMHSPTTNATFIYPTKGGGSPYSQVEHHVWIKFATPILYAKYKLKIMIFFAYT